MSKTCLTCKKCLEATCFGKHKGRKDNLADSCKLCRNKSAILKRYNLSQDEIDKMSNSQNNKCAICKLPQIVRPKRLAIDHCHVTGKVRGMLCLNCNQGLGKFKDSTDLLLSAMLYLDRFYKKVD